MKGKLPALILLATVSTAGCSKKAHPVDNATAGTGLTAFEAVNMQASAYQLRVRDQDKARFIAVSHKLEVLAGENSLPKAWQSVIDFCGTIRCEVVSSSIATRTKELAPSAAIFFRVVPEDYPKLFSQVEMLGTIVQQITQSEDKTSDVIDTEAKLKNLTAYRDSLRSMLSRAGLSVKDSVEIQEKLTEVQSNLDGETAQRKVLASETEKISVEINFRVERNARTRSSFAPIWDALADSGQNISESVATMIMVVVAVIPWLVLITLLIWLLIRLRRKYRK